MNHSNDPNELAELASDIVKRFQYTTSMLYHWIESFGLEETLNLLENLRKPFDSLWVQVNSSRIDFDSLVDIFVEMEFEAKKHPWFDDFIVVNVKKQKIEGDVLQLPVVKVDRESASNISLGKDVKTASITSHNSFLQGDKIRIMDFTGNIIALGNALVNSKEIASLTQRAVVRVTNSLGYAPPLTELKEYRRGYFSILTPPQVIGVKSLNLGSRDNILVISGDRGEVAGYITELTKHKNPITVVARNEMQFKAITKQIERIKTKAIRVIHSSFLAFLNEKKGIKYTSVYLEPQNSRTAVIPTFASNLSLSRLQKMSNRQIKTITQLYRSLHTESSISYVTHSLDYLENETVFQNILEKAYYNSQDFPYDLRKLQERKILSSRFSHMSKLLDLAEEQELSSIYLDPMKINNIGGFIAKFKFKQKLT